MTKQILSYFIAGVLSLTFVSGCINYTNTGTEQETPVQEVEVKESPKPVSGYTDFRNPTQKTSQDNTVPFRLMLLRKLRIKNTL